MEYGTATNGGIIGLSLELERLPALREKGSVPFSFYSVHVAACSFLFRRSYTVSYGYLNYVYSTLFYFIFYSSFFFPFFAVFPPILFHLAFLYAFFLVNKNETSWIEREKNLIFFYKNGKLEKVLKRKFFFGFLLLLLFFLGCYGSWRTNTTTVEIGSND